MIHKLGIGVMFMIFGVISMVVCYYLRENMQETIGLDKEKVYGSFMPKGLVLPTVQEPENKPLKVKEKSQ